MSMPPVGQNLIPGNGAATALSHGTPPDCSAGKNLSTVKPRSISAIASLTVAQPGTTGTGASASAAASAGGVPGLTRYFAPALSAAGISALRVTVPTPTTQSGTSAAMACTASSAARVRTGAPIAGGRPAGQAGDSD